MCTMWGGGPPTNAYLRAKLKVSFFENGQCIVFDKSNYFLERKVFIPTNKNFGFLKKKKNNFPFFGNVFRKLLFQNFQNVSAHNKFEKKKISKKNIFFQKNKVLVYRSKKNIFSLKQKLILSKINCTLNCPFSKTKTFCFAPKK